MHGNCLLKHITERKMEGTKKVAIRWARRHTRLLNGDKERRQCYKLTDEALDGTLCSTCFGRNYSPAVTQTTEWIKLNPKLVENFNSQETMTFMFIHSTCKPIVVEFIYTTHDAAQY